MATCLKMSLDSLVRLQDDASGRKLPPVDSRTVLWGLFGPSPNEPRTPESLRAARRLHAPLAFQAKRNTCLMSSC